MKILELRVRDLGVIEAVDVTPDPASPVVVLTGPNGAGKSTSLTAIEAALAGADALPKEPIRRGAKAAQVDLVLGDAAGPKFRVERKVTAKGAYLKVFDADGRPVASPQAFLDALTKTGLAYDPGSWLRKPPREQAAELLRAGGVDLAPLEARHKALFEERTGVNRDAKALAARLQAMAAVPGVAADSEEVSIGEMAKEMAALQAQREANAAERRKAAEAAAADARAAESAERARVEVVAMEAKLAAMRAKANEANRAAFEAETLASAEAARVAVLVDPDLGPVAEKMAGAEEHNRKVRAAKARSALVRELESKTAEAERLTGALADLDAQRRGLVGGLALGLDGLGLSETGVTFKGLPLEQASQAEQVRISLAVGLRSGELRVVLVRDGAHLDPAGMRLVAEYAAQHGAQVWIERPDTGAPQAGFRIVDGKVEE